MAVVTPQEVAEVTRQGAQYMRLAHAANHIPFASALFRFAATQLAECVNDGLDWHILAANAAARDARSIINAT